MTAKRVAYGIFRSRRRGFALLVVLFVVVLLSVALAGYSMKVSFAHQLARSRGQAWKLLFAARAGVEESKAKLWRQAYGPLEFEEEAIPSRPSDRPLLLSDEKEGLLRVAPEPVVLNLEGVEVTVWFEDEAGKLPVNAFAAPGAESRALALALARLFDTLDLRNSTSLATALRDFIDPDRQGSKERGALNHEIFHISELAGARDWDMEALYTPTDEEMPAAADCLSTWHTGRININSAQPVVLSSLAPRLTHGELEEIIAARTEMAFSSADDLKARVAIAADAQTQLGESVGFTTDTFTLYVEARAGGYLRRVKAVIWLEPGGGHTRYFAEGWDF